MCSRHSVHWLGTAAPHSSSHPTATLLPSGDSLVCCQGKVWQAGLGRRFAHNTGWGLKVDMLVQAQDSSWRLASVSGSGGRGTPSGRGLPAVSPDS